MLIRDSNTRVFTKKVQHVFKFEARIVFNESSRNALFKDEWPRYRIVPWKLLKLLNYTHDAQFAGNNGYKRVEEFGCYVKNSNMTELACNTLFEDLSENPPFHWNSTDEYTVFAQKVFAPDAQSTLHNRYVALAGQGLEKNDQGVVYVPITSIHFDDRDVKMGQDTTKIGRKKWKLTQFSE